MKFSMGKKMFRIFEIIYNFTIAITRIHFAIYEAQIDNLNPDLGYHEYFMIVLKEKNIVAVFLKKLKAE